MVEMLYNIPQHEWKIKAIADEIRELYTSFKPENINELFSYHTYHDFTSFFGLLFYDHVPQLCKKAGKTTKRKLIHYLIIRPFDAYISFIKSLVFALDFINYIDLYEFLYFFATRLPCIDKDSFHKMHKNTREFYFYLLRELMPGEKDLLVQNIINTSIPLATIVDEPHITRLTVAKFANTIRRFHNEYYDPYMQQVMKQFLEEYLPPSIGKILSQYYLNKYRQTYNFECLKNFLLIERHRGKDVDMNYLTMLIERGLKQKNLAVDDPLEWFIKNVI